MDESTQSSGSRYREGVPFAVGRCHRVRRDFRALRDSFKAGDLLTFESEAYSRYDGMTGYFFSQPGVQHLRVWDLGDDESSAMWRELFEEMSNDQSGAA